MIRVAGLTKRHPGAARPTLAGVELALEAGQLGAVVGASGAGKTTLLRCLAGLDPFEAGTIHVGDQGGEAARGGPGVDTGLGLRGRVGLVFQRFELFPHLSVLDNCTLGPRKVKGLSREGAEAVALKLLERLGIGERASARPAELSGGQQQRAAIARALAMAPQVLLYDEPTSALDPSRRRDLLALLREVRGTGMTQLIVTHDLAFARDAADLLFVVDAGQVVEAGPPADLLAAPRAEATRRLLAHG